MDRHTYVIPAVTAAIVSLAVSGAALGTSMSAELIPREREQRDNTQPMMNPAQTGILQQMFPMMDNQGQDRQQVRPPSMMLNGDAQRMPIQLGTSTLSTEQLQKMEAQIQKKLDELDAKMTKRETQLRAMADKKLQRLEEFCTKKQKSLTERIAKATDELTKTDLQEIADTAQNQCDERQATIEDQLDERILQLEDQTDAQREMLQERLNMLQDQMDEQTTSSSASATQ